jgi:DNA-3-methyladenine glycosylase
MLVSNKSLPHRSVMKSAKVSVVEELVRPLPRSFYDKGTVTVARKLLGKRLVRVRGRVELIGRIVEVEAYRGRDDPASHAYRGKTPRNTPMFGEPGHAYIYFTYGNHYCLNVTTQRPGVAGAVLIRAVEPLNGLSLMRRLRPGVPDLQLTNGPGKLTKAFAIDKSLNEIDLTKLGHLFIGQPKSESMFVIERSPRIGITLGNERLWRFYIKFNPYVSRH